MCARRRRPPRAALPSPAQAGGQRVPQNASGDSLSSGLSSFFEGRSMPALGDSGGSGGAGAPGGLRGGGDDAAAAAAAAHPLDPSAGPLHGLGLFGHLGSLPGGGGGAAAAAGAPHPPRPQQRRDSLTGRPLRARVGSVASISEEDLFSSTGGLELGHDGGGGGGDGGQPPGPDALAPADGPTRTLVVSNVPPEAGEDEVRALFAAHGELRALAAAQPRGRGCVAVSYFDLRAATRAAALLQGALLRGRALEVAFAAPRGGARGGGGSGGALSALGGGGEGSGGGGGSDTPGSAASAHAHAGGAAAAAAGGRLDQGVIVVYNLDPDTTNEQLAWIFNRFGEVKEIREAAARANQKFIEFYDIRHAAAALRAMNRAELAGRPPLAGAAAAAAGAGVSAAGTPTAGALVPGGSGSGGVLAIESAAQSAARGMVRPASHALLDGGGGASPRLGQGPMSQSWDPAFSQDSLLSMLGRPAPGQAGSSGAGGSGSAGSSAAPLPGSQQLPGGFPPGVYHPSSAQAALQQALQASGLFGPLVSGGRGGVAPGRGPLGHPRAAVGRHRPCPPPTHVRGPIPLPSPAALAPRTRPAATPTRYPSWRARRSCSAASAAPARPRGCGRQACTCLTQRALLPARAPACSRPAAPAAPRRRPRWRSTCRA
jgi:hypothetical protein